MSQSNTSNQAAGQPSILSNLTFGIEFEFLAFAPENVNPQKSAMKALRRPVLVQCLKCNDTHAFVLPVEGIMDKPLPYQVWTSHNDCSLEIDRNTEGPYLPEDCRFFQLEIVSRVLNFTKPTPDPLGQIYPCTGEPFEWLAETEISCILQRLSETFSRPGFLLCNNRTTGIHTHWGNGRDMPPTKTSIGMFGVFTALERLFDGILPISRICSTTIKGPSLGIERPYAVYPYADIKESHYVGSGSRVFLEDLARTTRNAMTQDPQQTRSTILGGLRNCNVPAWLESLSTHEDVEAFLDSWPQSASRGRATLSQRLMAVNLTNLQRNYGAKGTIEIRATPGSRDIAEICAWCDLMGKLVLWLSTPDIEHNAIIVGIWANPQSSIHDLLRLVGASQSTFDFYTDRLSSDWAERRYERLTSGIEGHPYEQFIRAVEENRLQDCRRFYVDSKVQAKLEDGLYGQHPDAFLRAKLPSELYNHQGSSILNMHTCDFESRADKTTKDSKALAAARANVPEKKRYLFVPPSSTGSSDATSSTALSRLSSNPHNSLVPPNFFTVAPANQNTPQIPADMDDPFTTTSPDPTPSRAIRNTPATVEDLADLITRQTNADRDVVMDDDSVWGSSLPGNTPSGVRLSRANSQEDFVFRATSDDQRTFAVPAPEGGFPDTRPETPPPRPKTPDSRPKTLDSDLMDES